METKIDIIAQLKKALALEAGNYDVAPSALTQGGALQREELDDIMHSVTVGNDQLSLQKEMDTKPYKSNLVQFNRQLSHGILGGSARQEGAVGQEEVSDYIRATVPMSYYSELRRTTLVANIVATFDGTKAEDRASESAALRLGCDIEMDCFRGQATSRTLACSTATRSCSRRGCRTCRAWTCRFVSPTRGATPTT